MLGFGHKPCLISRHMGKIIVKWGSRLGLIVVCLMIWPSAEISAKSFHRDGKFKQLDSERDRWFYVDHNNWYIKAPDKWTHFMGGLALTEVTSSIIKDKTWAGVISLGLGLLKEVDDAYREGWSRRDIYMDIGGVAASVLLPERMKLLAYYDDSSVMLKLSLIVK